MSVQDTPTRDSLRLESDKLVYDWGWIDCEERIIKMLENDQTDCLCDDCYTNRATEVPFEVKHNEYIIALIKGEK